MWTEQSPINLIRLSSLAASPLFLLQKKYESNSMKFRQFRKMKVTFSSLLVIPFFFPDVYFLTF